MTLERKMSQGAGQLDAEAGKDAEPPAAQSVAIVKEDTTVASVSLEFTALDIVPAFVFTSY